MALYWYGMENGDNTLELKGWVIIWELRALYARRLCVQVSRRLSFFCFSLLSLSLSLVHPSVFYKFLDNAFMAEQTREICVGKYTTTSVSVFNRFFYLYMRHAHVV